MVNSEVNLPNQTVYRRVVTKAKNIHILNVIFKQINIARRIEINWILARADFRLTDQICDVGCGDGYWSSVFSRNVFRVFALDPFHDDLNKALYFQGPKLFFFNAVGENIPMLSSSMDKVISVCVFEHCFKDVQAFREVYRILKPGGRLLATVDSLDSPEISDDHREWHKKAFYCSQLYTQSSLIEKLQSAGFEQIEVHYILGSKLGIWWEKFIQKVGTLANLLAPLVYPILLLAERYPQSSGYKIFVVAQK